MVSLIVFFLPSLAQ
jgi:hypothetical protein